MGHPILGNQNHNPSHYAVSMSTQLSQYYNDGGGNQVVDEYPPDLYDMVSLIV